MLSAITITRSLKRIASITSVLILSGIGFLTVPMLVPSGLLFLLALPNWISPPSPGTVRNSNFANLEAVLNIWTILWEVLGIVSGVCFILHGLRVQKFKATFLGNEIDLPGSKRFTIGVGLALSAVAVPHCINWLVAAVRDANLLS